MLRTLLITAALAAGAFTLPAAANASSLSVAEFATDVTALPVPNQCPLNATTCIPALPGPLPHGGGGGGRHPEGGDDSGITGGNHDSYCAALGAQANTAFGQQLL